MIPISVVIPVGPKPHHSTWLAEMIESICFQTVLPDEVVFVDDGGHLDHQMVRLMFGSVRPRLTLSFHRNPWNLGVVASLNVGVAIARNDHVLLGCADDKLLPKCVEGCWSAWEKWQDLHGYYYLGVRYSDGREQNTACGAAMVTKQLWEYTGGFPKQASVGAADHIFLSMLLSGSNGGYSDAKIIRVSDEVLYWYRVHGQIETSNNIWPAIEAVKDRLNHDWRPQTS